MQDLAFASANARSREIPEGDRYRGRADV